MAASTTHRQGISWLLFTIVMILGIAIFGACLNGEARSREPKRQDVPTVVTRAPGPTKLPPCTGLLGEGVTDHPDCTYTLSTSRREAFTLFRGLSAASYYDDFLGSGHVLFIGTGYNRLDSAAWILIDIGSTRLKLLASSKSPATHPQLGRILRELGLK